MSNNKTTSTPSPFAALEVLKGTLPKSAPKKATERVSKALEKDALLETPVRKKTFKGGKPAEGYVGGHYTRRPVNQAATVDGNGFVNQVKPRPDSLKPSTTPNPGGKPKHRPRNKPAQAKPQPVDAPVVEAPKAKQKEKVAPTHATFSIPLDAEYVHSAMGGKGRKPIPLFKPNHMINGSVIRIEERKNRLGLFFGRRSSRLENGESQDLLFGLDFANWAEFDDFVRYINDAKGIIDKRRQKDTEHNRARNGYSVRAALVNRGILRTESTLEGVRMVTDADAPTLAEIHARVDAEIAEKRSVSGECATAAVLSEIIGIVEGDLVGSLREWMTANPYETCNQVGFGGALITILETLAVVGDAQVLDDVARMVACFVGYKGYKVISAEALIEHGLMAYAPPKHNLRRLRQLELPVAIELLKKVAADESISDVLEQLFDLTDCPNNGSYRLSDVFCQLITQAVATEEHKLAFVLVVLYQAIILDGDKNDFIEGLFGGCSDSVNQQEYVKAALEFGICKLPG